MRQFKNILVLADAVSKSKANTVFGRSVELARQHNADLKIVSVLDEFRSCGRSVVPVSCDLEGLVEQRKTQLEQLAAPTRAQGIKVCTKVFCGPPALAISREVASAGHDLVMKNAEAEQIGSSRLFGTLAQRLMRTCPCAVWVVQRSEVGLGRLILATVDFTGRDALNKTIVEVATSLSHSQVNALHALHAWGVSRAKLASLTEVSAMKFLSLERMARTTSAKKLTESLAPWSSVIPQDHIHFVRAPAVSVISRFAANYNVDTIVMGSVGRSGIAGLLIGNTAERVLRQVNCSALVVKPEDFVSPVQCASRVAALDI